MKRFLLFLVIAFACINVNAQTIDGIGKLHLEMSFKDVEAVFPKSLVRLKTNSKVKKVYKINTYTPVKGHMCKDVRLFFYHDTLYAIYITKPPMILLNSLKLKYGEPTENYQRFSGHAFEIIGIFQYDYDDFIDGYFIDKTDVTDTYYEWNSGNPMAQCQFWHCIYKDKNGNLSSNDVFLVRNKIVAEMVHLEDKIIDKESEGERKKELEGL